MQIAYSRTSLSFFCARHEDAELFVSLANISIVHRVLERDIVVQFSYEEQIEFVTS